MLAPSTYQSHHMSNLYLTMHLVSSPDALAYLISEQESWVAANRDKAATTWPPEAEGGSTGATATGADHGPMSPRNQIGRVW